MLLKNCDVCGKKEKAELNYKPRIFLDYCYSHDSKNTGIFVSEPSAPRSREPSMALFYENVQATAASEHLHLKN